MVDSGSTDGTLEILRRHGVAAVSADAEERLIDGFASEQDAQDWIDARRTSNLWAAELFGLTPNH